MLWGRQGQREEDASDRPRQVGSIEELRRERQATSNRQAESYGRWLLVLLIVQLVLANGMMALYAEWGVDWRIPNTVMHAWLAATVVQVVGLVWVVVSHLFPKADDRDEGR